jgi:hypothetical protein
MAGSADPFQSIATLYGESASRIVVSVAPAHSAQVWTQRRWVGVPARVIGETGGDQIQISVGGSVAVKTTVARAEMAWATVIERTMARRGDASR